MDQNSIEKLFKDHLLSDQRRLDRIEEKIDKLAEFVVQIARVEEKIEHLEISRDKMGERQGELEKSLMIAQNAINNHDTVMTSITRLFWAVITTGVSAVVGALLLGMNHGI